MKNAILFTLFVLLPLTAVADAPKPVARVTAPAVIDVEKVKLTKNQLDKLPDSQVIELHGKLATLGALRGNRKAMLARGTAPKIDGTMKKAKFDADRNKLLAEQKNRIAARNAQVLAEFQRQKSQRIAAPR